MKEGINETKVIVTNGDSKIKKVEMKESGRDGAKVTTVFMEVINGVQSPRDRTDSIHRPVHKEVRNYFGLLKKHFLNLLEYRRSNETVEALYESLVEVSSVEYDRSKDKLRLGASVKTRAGVVNVSTALVDGDVYDDYQEMADVCLKIFDEIKLYMSGLKVADRRQVAVDYMVGKKGIENAESEFDKMSKEEQDEYVRNAFENYGLKMEMEDGEMVVTVEDEEVKEELVVGTESKVVFMGNSFTDKDVKETKKAPAKGGKKADKKKVVEEVMDPTYEEPVFESEKNEGDDHTLEVPKMEFEEVEDLDDDAFGEIYNPLEDKTDKKK